jgi:hypothetical protein
MKCSQCQFENVADTRFCGNCEGTYFITMEYIAGDNLKSINRMMGRFFWKKRTSEGMKRGLV